MYTFRIFVYLCRKRQMDRDRFKFCVYTKLETVSILKTLLYSYIYLYKSCRKPDSCSQHIILNTFKFSVVCL